jgi:hypothetical protein
MFLKKPTARESDFVRALGVLQMLKQWMVAKVEARKSMIGITKT